MFVQATGFDGLSVAKIEAMTLAAMKTWNSVPGTKIALVYGGLVTAPPRTGVYIWRDPAFSWRGTEVLAEPTLEWDEDGALTMVSIALNGKDFRFVAVQKTSSAADGRGDADLGTVLTHQLGHALGLGHSRDPTATMYFWQTTQPFRTLKPDDQDGLRFVYPADAVTASATCDACRSDADCGGGGRCLVWPDGAAYCAGACEVDDDCPVGTSCGTYSAGRACLPNDGHCNADRATAHFGEPCAADRACVDTGFCMTVDGGQGYCTTTCEAGCPGGGGNCDPNGLCTAHGTRVDGDTCRVPGDCQSGVCAGSTWRLGSCAHTCNGLCPKGETCGEDGVCHTACAGGCPVGMACDDLGQCRGPMDIGWPCASPYDCKRGSCITVAAQLWPSICTQGCTVPTDCSNGTGCAKTASGYLCVPGKALAIGSPCDNSPACGTGAACDLDQAVGGYGACAAACDPYGDSAPCNGGWCVWRADSPTGGVCRASAGGQVTGQACSPTLPCRADLVCVTTSGTSQGFCAEDCNQTAPGCALGLSCLPLDASATRGVCLDGGTGGTTIAPQPASTYVNPDPRTVQLPDVVPVAQWKPPVATASSPAAGCAAGPRGPAASEWVGLCLIALVCVRRQRQPAVVAR